MKSVVINIADMQISNDPDSILVTYSLGSCIAVSIYDPYVKVSGLLHYMLPKSSLNQIKARDNPCMFGDTGIPLLFRKAYAFGARKERLIVKVAGGANIMDSRGFFNVGERNYVILRKLFVRNNIKIAGEHVGGNLNRTVIMNARTGTVRLKISGRREVYL